MTGNWPNTERRVEFSELNLHLSTSTTLLHDIAHVTRSTCTSCKSSDSLLMTAGEQSYEATLSGGLSPLLTQPVTSIS